MKAILITGFCLFFIVFQSQWISGQQTPAQQPPPKKEKSNLKVLPKNLSEEKLIGLMKEYSWSLGVKCGHCHAASQADATKLDFSSDAKPEKDIARKMIKMTEKINSKYIDKIAKSSNEHFEHIACVSCHMGKLKPIVSVDSIRTKKN